jgi:anti-sigma B factor antagonist
MSRPAVEHAGHHAIVSLTGDVDLVVRSDILASYEYAIGRMEIPHLLVDVSGVTFMDSTGISTLAAGVKRVQARGGTVTVVGASARIRWLLRIGHLDDLITVLPPGRCLLN